FPSPFPSRFFPLPIVPLASPPSLPSRVPLYCSAACSSSHSPIPSSSAESLLPPSSPLSSALRTALRLLLSLPSLWPHLHRFNNGLLTNYHLLSSSPEFATQICQGAIAIATSWKLRNGDSVLDQSDGVLLEEAVLSLVLIKAVEVQDEAGRCLGIAVYDPNFSWINHSCSPNSCFRFSVSRPNATSFGEDSSSSLRIVPSVSDDDSCVCICSDYMKGTKGYEYGPKIIVGSIKRIKKGEEVCVSYTDLLQPRAMRQSDLWFKYQFTCSCRRCTMSPSYVDHALEELASNLFSSSLHFDFDLYRDEANKKFSDYVDETVTGFLSVGDLESFCMKLESVLSLDL
ncbi:protein SET DOMAIN GROUP 41-like, partial [Hibiscus syriacus]|uniref:protein SET DOMAIN GROUP 41-like n=1 Tax=Hibiscus syriacus TaxID=106335 RepID=UPI0019242E91